MKFGVRCPLGFNLIKPISTFTIEVQDEIIRIEFLEAVDNEDSVVEKEIFQLVNLPRY